MASLETYRRFKIPLQIQYSRTLNNRSRSSQPSYHPSLNRARSKLQLVINRTTIQTQSNSKWYCLHRHLSLPQLQRFFRRLRRTRGWFFRRCAGSGQCARALSCGRRARSCAESAHLKRGSRPRAARPRHQSQVDRRADAPRLSRRLGDRQNHR